MSVIRVNKTENYTVMSNYHLQDRALPLKAKGLLSQMLSLPPEWDYTVEGLAALNVEKVSAITTALRDLKEAGYLVVTKLMPGQTKSGRIEYVYDIYEVPGEGKQEAKKQGIEIQGVEFQGIENRGQLNTNNKNTYILSIKYNKDIVEIVDFLNEKAGTKYHQKTPKTRSLITARLKEGFSVEDFKSVIEKKVAEWKDDDRMARYLRPETLFGTKFEAYLNQRPKEITTADLAAKMDFSEFGGDAL